MNFKELHQQQEPLLICNVWDAASAKIAEQLNFKAIGTSSAAIASSNGYEDGENLTFDTLLDVVKSITNHCGLPLTVDIEAGYSRDYKQIVENIKSLASLGVVGINIEDSIVDEHRRLVNAKEFSELVAYIKQELTEAGVTIFLNVRTDTYILSADDCLSETKNRIDLYESAGADGIFVPCIVNEQEIKAVVSSTDLPINVMCMPHLPTFETLNALGVIPFLKFNSVIKWPIFDCINWLTFRFHFLIYSMHRNML